MTHAIYARSTLTKKYKSSLIQICETRGLDSTGLKNALINRIIEAQPQKAAKSAPAPMILAGGVEVMDYNESRQRPVADGVVRWGVSQHGEFVGSIWILNERYFCCLSSNEGEATLLEAVELLCLVPTPEAVTSTALTPDYDYLDLALQLSGCTSIRALKIYCDAHAIDQNTLFGIYAQILNLKVYGYNGEKAQGNALYDLLRAEEAKSEALCNILGIEVVDLSLKYGDVVIPSGSPSFEIYRIGSDNVQRLEGVLTEHPNEGTYHVYKKNQGFDNPYSAALNFASHCELKAAQSQLIENYELAATYPDYM